MWIKSLEVEHWRGLEHALLDDLGPHFNLISGPNESGKSRLMQALRFGLFESSRGQGLFKKSLQTWRTGAARPRVRIAFDLDGRVWHVEKAFVGTQHDTRLTSGSQAFEGEAAEQQLRTLLGTEAGSNSSPATDAQLGLWSLLWVDQGRSGDIPAVSDNERIQGSLQSRLTAQVGEVAAGDLGQRVRTLAQAEAGAYVSLATGRELKGVSDLRKAAEAASVRRGELARRVDAVAAMAEALERARREARELDERQFAAAERLAAARAKLAHTLETARELEQARLGMEQALAAIDERQARVDQITALEADRARLLGEQAALEQTLATVRQADAEARSDLEALRRAVREAEALQETGNQARSALQRQVRERAARREARALRERLDEAAGFDAALATLREALAASAEIDAKAVAALRALDHDRFAARARLEGASAELVLRAEQDLTVDGETLAAGCERSFLVDHDRAFEVAGLLSIGVRPGSGELETLRDRLADLESDLNSRLEAWGVSTLSEAEQIERIRSEQLAEQARAHKQLERLFPEGREAVRTRLADLQQRFAPAAERPGAGADPAESPADLEQALATAERDAEQATTRAQEARTRRDYAGERASTVQNAVVEATARLEGLRSQVAQLASQLESMLAHGAAVAALEQARTAHAEAVRVHAALQARFTTLGGDEAASDVERAASAHDNLLEALRANSDDQIRLEQDLKHAGSQSLHEDLQAAEYEETKARRDLERTERQAAAAVLLCDLIEEEYVKAQERLAAPVIARIQPYLADLFPGSAPALESDFQLRGLSSGGGVSEPFDQLSAGAREQLALLVRIGLAEVLGEEQSWPLVLDDVLVNTDRERIARVQRLLYRASRATQIILFTCHGPMFDELGADRVIHLPPRLRAAG